MRSQRTFRLLTAGVLIAGASLAIPGNAPASLAAAPAMLTAFTWSGAASGNGWLAPCNWHPAPSCNFLSPIPDGTDDHPTFPVVSGEWGIILFDFDYNSTFTIGDMTILDGVDFDSDPHPHEMTAETLTINADDGDITVTFTGTLEYTANLSP